jgi:O-antigen ligase
MVPAGHRNSFLHTMGFLALLAYFFFLVSRVLDLTVPQLRIPLVLFGLLLAGALFSGVTRLFSSRVNWFFGMHVAWIAVAVPFSYWRSGSFELWRNSLKVIVFFYAIQILLSDWGKLRWAIRVLAAGFLTAALLSILTGDSSSGRLKLQVGTLSDPNEFAMYMILGLCFVLQLWNTAKNRVAATMLSLPAVGLILISFLKTGSRGGLVALAVVFVIWVLHSRMMTRMLLVMCACVAMLLAPFFMTDYVKSRLLTFNTIDEQEITDEQTASRLGGSVASTESRKQLVLESLELTATHPLFGVGPGMFPLYSDLRAKEAGLRRGHWQPTHNMFTQISSECGVPALLFYVAGLVVMVFSLRRIRQASDTFPAAEAMRETAGYLLMGFYGVVSAGMFLSIAYGTIVYVVVALSLALVDIYDQEAARYRKNLAVAAAAPGSQRDRRRLPGYRHPAMLPVRQTPGVRG